LSFSAPSDRSSADVSTSTVDQATSWFPYLLSLAAGVCFMMWLSPLQDHMNQRTKAAGSVTKNPMNGLDASSPKILADASSADNRKSKVVLVSMDRPIDKELPRKLEGRLLWDPFANEIHLSCSSMRPAPLGMQYVFDILGDRERVLASKVLDVDASGRCKATASIPLAPIKSLRISLQTHLRVSSEPENQVELTLDAKKLMHSLN
jgi:hypothetical protein